MPQGGQRRKGLNVANYDAVIEVVYSERSNRVSTASAKRLVKALKVLGLTQDEIIAVLYRMEYCKQDGEPYGPKIKRVW
jgi:hypothetical protein